MDYNSNMPGYNNQYGQMMPQMPNYMQQPMQMPQMICVPVYLCPVMPQAGMEAQMPYMQPNGAYCPEMYGNMNMPYNPTYDYTMPEME